jgi:hypothetical protein
VCVLARASVILRAIGYLHVMDNYFSFLDMSPIMKVLLRAFAISTSLDSYYLLLWVPHVFSLQLLTDLLKTFDTLALSWLIRWNLQQKTSPSQICTFS